MYTALPIPLCVAVVVALCGLTDQPSSCLASQTRQQGYSAPLNQLVLPNLQAL